jgi:2-oxoglutarate ferredoxin oxidoreductase subunit gamma
MSEIIEVRLSGFGGQGVVLAGVLLGEAGVIDGKYVSGSNSYGAQARGTGCKSEIVFSDGPIDFPHLITSDMLVAFSQGAYNLYCGDVRESSGIILYDQGQVTPQGGLKLRQIGIQATECALMRLKNKQVANIVLLGALVETMKIVSPEAMEKAMKTHVSERFRSLNLEALKLGMELGRSVHG